MSVARTVAQLVNSTGTETDSGNLPTGGGGDKAGDTLVLALDVTSFTGTAPTLDIALEWSFDGGTTWHVPSPAVAFAQVGGATQEIIETEIKAPLYRLVYTWGGTVTDADLVIHEHVR